MIEYFRYCAPSEIVPFLTALSIEEETGIKILEIANPALNAIMETWYEKELDD